jgi:hypothetical protein
LKEMIFLSLMNCHIKFNLMGEFFHLLGRAKVR